MPAPRLYDWELPPAEGRSRSPHAASSSQAAAWELPPEDSSADFREERPDWEKEDSDSEDAANQAEARQALGELLADLRMAGVLNSKQLCTIAWWASKAGSVGQVHELAFRPDAPSGHYQRHLDIVLQTRRHDARLYWIGAPGYDKKWVARQEMPFAIVPFHESLCEEVDADPSICTTAQRRTEAKEWPPCFMQHPVLRSAPAGVPVVPYTLYLDAVPYTTVDSVLGVFAYTEVSGRRHLIAGFAAAVAEGGVPWYTSSGRSAGAWRPPLAAPTQSGRTAARGSKPARLEPRWQGNRCRRASPFSP